MNTEMKALLFTDTFCDINGVSRFIQDISRISQERGLSFHVVTSSIKPCPQFDNVTILQPIFRMQIPFYPDLDLALASTKALEAVVDEIDPDVIHISTPGFIGWKARKIARKRGIPMVGTYHTDFPQFAYKNIPFKMVKKLGERVMRSFYKEFKAIFVRSEAYRKIVREDVKFDPKHIHTLLAGIDTQTFHKGHKDMSIWEAYGIPEHATKALYVGRLTKEKNFPLLLELWKRYYAQSPNKDIYLVAAGGDLEDQTLFERYHIKSVGVKRGEALSKLYASSDLFLFPSTTDTLGQVVMEAMSSGLPVIVSDQGGPMTLIDEKNPAGYAIDIKDEAAWLDTIDMLIKDASLRRTLGENGHRKIAGMGIAQSFDAFWETHRTVTEM